MNIRNELINEICKGQGITIDYLSDDYILRLTKGVKIRHIFGPYWDINNAAADRLACDKAACYTILKKCKIPAVEHKLIYNPTRWTYLLTSSGNTNDILSFFEANNKKIVVKPVDGAQGRDVYYCDTMLAVEQAIHTIFAIEPHATLCPYYDISTEYRVFYLNGRVYYTYGKTKGDDWRHNLAQGAKAFDVNNGNLRELLANLAMKAAKCIDINFATIDIATIENNELLVMEINSGVQAQHLLKQLPHRRNTIKNIYADAITSMFRD